MSLSPNLTISQAGPCLDQCCHEYFFWDEYEYRIYSETEIGPNTNIFVKLKNIRMNIRMSQLFEYSNIFEYFSVNPVIKGILHIHFDSVTLI